MWPTKKHFYSWPFTKEEKLGLVCVYVERISVSNRTESILKRFTVLGSNAFLRGRLLVIVWWALARLTVVTSDQDDNAKKETNKHKATGS